MGVGRQAADTSSENGALVVQEGLNVSRAFAIDVVRAPPVRHPQLASLTLYLSAMAV